MPAPGVLADAGERDQGGSRRPRDAFGAFVQSEASGGIVLVVMALIALIWANSGVRHGYESLWDHHVSLGFGCARIDESLHAWVNDALMAVFFFIVGVEIKRELVVGELRDRQAAMLPAVAAIGGMVVPAVIFAALNAGQRGSGGWGIPMATDIAFALGILALLGPRIPAGLKVFLLALAIVDDLGAIAVIALFYSKSMSGGWLLLAAANIVLLCGLWIVGVRSRIVFIVCAVTLWIAVFKSGVHATVAGVILGLLLPTHPQPNRRGKNLPTAESVEHVLHPWSAFVVMPVFALANAGVRINGSAFDGVGAGRVAIGVVAGLLVGKILGISIAVWVAVRMGLAVLPASVSWVQIFGAAALAGIGFTVSLFVSDLAFGDPSLRDAAKIGVLAASVIAGIVGSVALMAHSRREISCNDR